MGRNWLSERAKRMMGGGKDFKQDVLSQQRQQGDFLDIGVSRERKCW